MHFFFFFYLASDITSCKWISAFLPVIWVGFYERGTQWTIRVQVKFTHFLSSGFPGKQTLRQKYACRKVTGECPGEQCLWECKGARLYRAKLNCKTASCPWDFRTPQGALQLWIPFTDIPYLTNSWMQEEGSPWAKKFSLTERNP